MNTSFQQTNLITLRDSTAGALQGDDVGAKVVNIAWMSIPDIQGSYSVPYIQSNGFLQGTVEFGNRTPISAALSLIGPGFRVEQTVEKTAPDWVFDGLKPGEYTLEVDWRDGTGVNVSQTTVTRIGVGAVLGALGDSLTEGYHGHGFKRDSLELSAGNFPAEAVSKDGRNFPQFSPTTVHHNPAVNCFQSWLTSLNDRLTKTWQMPVFIANEGWGSITSSAYLGMMRGNGSGWADRMRRLKPTSWLIHLGVNDERNQVPAAEFAANMRGIITTLIQEYQAEPKQIFLAYPSYDYAPGAEPQLRAYIAEIDILIAEMTVCQGPDFFTTFSEDRARWYGTDPVHPGIEGMELMAELWAKVLAENAPAVT